MKSLAKRIPQVNRLLSQRDELIHDKGVLQLEKGNLEADVRKLKEALANVRTFLAGHYIRGNGIEIGPTYLPVQLPKSAKVKYVDEAPLEELYKRYPELKKTKMAPVHIVDNAEKLNTIKANSLDFIIANHFMEHTRDPIGTLINHQKKLRKNGLLFYAIPDKRYTFDKKRPITPYKHLLQEHNNPTHEMTYQHFLEASEFLDHQKGEANIKKRAQELFDMKYSIHYHVWTRKELIEFFSRAIDEFNLDLEIVCVLDNNPEAIFILRKTK